MPEELANLQRARMIAAARQVVEELGYARLTVASVVVRAKVSRKTFYDLFAGREDCFLAVLEQAVARPRRLACQAYAQQESWRTGMRAAIETVLVIMDEEPGLARLCLVEALGAGADILSFRTELMRGIAHALDAGRSEPSALRSPSAITAEAVTGGIFAVLHNKLCQTCREPVIDLLGPLMSMITLPYLGTRAAGQELDKPSSGLARVNGHASGPESDPAHGLNIRLTYRTTRALMAIAERPGASNRDVALAAGIADQGQVSKLLNRLSRLELIKNTGAGHRKGLPNAWRLTERGQRLRPEAWSHEPLGCPVEF
jgi:AcrR family transcriptional regulator/DNA-binding MarR family transcriptional regulator